MTADVTPSAHGAGRRDSGVLVHPTSLPGPLGTGDLGRGARDLVDFLVAAGQSVWQMLPVHPPGPGTSPYQALSAFAGSALLVDPEELVDLGLLVRADVDGERQSSRRRADTGHARRARSILLVRAYETFERELANAGESALALADELAAFADRNAAWLPEWTLYAALKAEHEERSWVQWDAAARDRKEGTGEHLNRAREFHAFVQLLFDRQWRAIRSYANERGVRILGDLPMFVAHDSADVWSDRSLFRLADDGNPTHVSGAPPDDFNASGQVWGHPLFDWNAVAEREHDWWIARVRRACELFDEVRLDHFVGYRAAWEVPFGARTAADGSYGEGPGGQLFDALSRALGPLPFVAEDLGDVTPEVEALRARLGFPGMRVLQFAFRGDAKENVHTPHNHTKDSVVYTGTHDNDTTAGWFAGLGDAERARVLACTGGDGSSIAWDLMRLGQLSLAGTAITPVQDLLGLGTRSRMNRPGTASGNWCFRLRPGELTPALTDRMAELASVAGREPRL